MRLITEILPRIVRLVSTEDEGDCQRVRALRQGLVKMDRGIGW